LRKRVQPPSPALPPPGGREVEITGILIKFALEIK